MVVNDPIVISDVVFSSRVVWFNAISVGASFIDNIVIETVDTLEPNEPSFDLKVNSSEVVSVPLCVYDTSELYSLLLGLFDEPGFNVLLA